MPSVNLSPEVEQFLATNPVVAVGVSGGKDSHACAMAVHRYLDQIKFDGVRVMVHADLGSVEWEQSLPKCQELADSLGWELMIVKRNAGDLMVRWNTRWTNNVARYIDLSCVQLILPWSTASMRFCTSELKASVIRSGLKKRFPGMNIVNVTGVRRQESSSRAKMPLFKDDPQLATKKTQAMTWNAIIDWSLEEVFSECKSHTVALHEAYTKYNMSRVSCSFCILSNLADLQNSSKCPSNHANYLQVVGLEVESGFSFQSNRWLGDVSPHLLSDEMRAGLEKAKQMSKARAALEVLIPKSMRYDKGGWPTGLPTLTDASLLAEVRAGVSELQGFKSKFLTGPEVLERYKELLAAKESKLGVEHLIPVFQLPTSPTHQFGLTF